MSDKNRIEFYFSNSRSSKLDAFGNTGLSIYSNWQYLRINIFICYVDFFLFNLSIFNAKLWTWIFVINSTNNAPKGPRDIKEIFRRVHATNFKWTNCMLTARIRPTELFRSKRNVKWLCFTWTPSKPWILDACERSLFMVMACFRTTYESYFYLRYVCPSLNCTGD